MPLGFWGQQTFHGLTWCKVWQSLFSMLDLYIKWILYYTSCIIPLISMIIGHGCVWGNNGCVDGTRAPQSSGRPSSGPTSSRGLALMGGRAGGRAADKGLIPAAVGWHTPTSQRNDSFCQSQTPAGDERAFNHTQTKMPEESLPTPACNDMFYKHCLEIDSECFLVLC